MRVTKVRIPAGNLDRARFFTALAAVVAVCQMVPETLNSDLPAGRHVAGVAAEVLLVTMFIWTYRRRRPVLGDVVTVPALMFIAGSALSDSMATISIGYAVLIGLSLYGSHGATALRTIGVLAAVPAALIAHPISFGRHLDWYHPAVISNLPQLAILAAVMRMLYVALLAQERAHVREAVLADTGSQLLGLKDPAEIRRVVRAAALQLCDLAPGTVAISAARDDGHVRIRSSAGSAGITDGTELPAEVLAGLDALDARSARPVTGGLAALAALAPQVRHWRAVGLASTEGERFMLVGAPKQVPDAVLDAFRTIGQQVTLAEANLRSHAELDHQANHDQLTGLPTRAPFFAAVTTAVDAAAPITVLNIDLDDFKQVNDVYGHAAGDELLVQVAQRLREVVAANGVAARFGGDEFAVLLTELHGADADDLAARLGQRLAMPFRLHAATVTVGASIGSAGWEPPLTAGDLMRCADIAMYSAKACGKNRVERFESGTHGDIARHRLIEDHLASAVQRGELIVHYQPYLDLISRECVGMEALVRWQHPTLGLLAPAEFLPAAQRSGQVVAIGLQVLRTACATLAGLDDQRLRVSVNVGTRQLLDPGFTRHLAEILRDTGLRPERLTIDLIGSDHSDEPAAVSQLRAVADAGVRIALDNVAVGQPSLTGLWAFPVHQLKVDVAALKEIPCADGETTMIQLITSIGSIMGVETAGKCITTEDQVEALRAAGMNLGQGHLLGPELPAADLVAWLHRNAEAQAVRTSADYRPWPHLAD